ncbi:MAG: MotA/TolQ/ExbB proton channel family protein [Candidatus Brocadiae bacterium]|nr:MotA/TolQ/ExbB proton channel family protein [Candidatus Brocadiia bacterium]
MLEMIQAGGIVLYIIIFSSIIAIGFAIERFLVFRAYRCDMNKFFPPLENFIKLGKMQEAIKYCETSRHLIPRLMYLGLLHKEESIEEIRQVLIDEIQLKALPSLQKRLGILSIVAKAAPMLGLLGTVLGMITTFEIIAMYGLGDPGKMANGIRLALVTTAGGLMVAIPVIFIQSYLLAQVKDFEVQIYEYITRFLRIMHKRKEVKG